MMDEKNKKGLGRGLMSLFGDQEETGKNTSESTKKIEESSFTSIHRRSEQK
jgi:hypothetical protein